MKDFEVDLFSVVPVKNTVGGWSENLPALPLLAGAKNVFSDLVESNFSTPIHRSTLTLLFLSHKMTSSPDVFSSEHSHAIEGMRADPSDYLKLLSHSQRGGKSHIHIKSQFSSKNFLRSNIEKSDEAKKFDSVLQIKSVLKNSIINDDFEFINTSSSERLTRKFLDRDPGQTSTALTELLMENYSNIKIVTGLLQIVSHFEYDEIKPAGPMMATATISHKNLEVRECAIRAFENWASMESLSLLEHTEAHPAWLQDYLTQVIMDIRGIVDVKAS